MKSQIYNRWKASLHQGLSKAKRFLVLFKGIIISLTSPKTQDAMCIFTSHFIADGDFKRVFNSVGLLLHGLDYIRENVAYCIDTRAASSGLLYS